MKKRAVCYFVFCVWMVSLYSYASFPAESGESPQFDELRSVAPNVFLDCSRRDCDMDYIRTEITFVNYVRDRQNSDVYILITRQRTGSGGSEYTLSFMGRGKYEAKDSVLKYYSKSIDTTDQVRKGLVNVLKQGLIPYVSDTPLAEFITVSYTRETETKTAPVRDKWDYWVFFTSFRGNLNFEELSKRYSSSISLSANRTTENVKFRFWVNGRFSERRYDVSEDERVISKSARKTIYTQLVKSLNDHWSYGGSVSLFSSTYDNAKLYTTFGPAIEYNLFPYDQATRRELRIQYRLEFSIRNYDEVTIYEKEKENLFQQEFQIVFELKEPWGSVGARISGANYLHDFSKNNFQIESGLSLKVLKGLSFDIEGEFSQVRDQLALPLSGASKEEILLELKRLETTYDLRLEVGFSFRFGSIYSNVVNPRFGNR